MKAFWTTTTKTAILLTIILLLSAAIASLATNSSGPGDIDYDDFYAYEDDWEGFLENLPAYDADVYAAHATAGTTGGGSGRITGSSSSVKDLVTANGLVKELRRIVRAGSSMDVLRNRANSVLKRRCYEGMQKLRSDIASIRQRRKNLAIGSSAESVSLDKVFSNIIKCVSCDGDASQFCHVAQKDLDTITRSLSLN